MAWLIVTGVGIYLASLIIYLLLRAAINKAADSLWGKVKR